VNVLTKLFDVKEKRGAGYLVLIDPDKQEIGEAVRLARLCEQADVDALLIGGSLLFSHLFDELIKAIKAECSLPVIIFPGSTGQLSPYADAILFLSLISGRNSNYLISNQVFAAPIIKSMNLETIATAYMFVEAGNVTSAQFMSDTRPLPREKPEIAMAHALAAEYLGLKLIYLEAGSGAKYSVPETMITAIKGYCSLPMIVGGGIRTPDDAAAKVKAGAGFIVTGNILEINRDLGLIKAFSQAIHITK
jgi:phosphoglycerol geranylgeranyltransferase